MNNPFYRHFNTSLADTSCVYSIVEVSENFVNNVYVHPEHFYYDFIHGIVYNDKEELDFTLDIIGNRINSFPFVENMEIDCIKVIRPWKCIPIPIDMLKYKMEGYTIVLRQGHTTHNKSIKFLVSTMFDINMHALFSGALLSRSNYFINLLLNSKHRDLNSVKLPLLYEEKKEEKEKQQAWDHIAYDLYIVHKFPLRGPVIEKSPILSSDVLILKEYMKSKRVYTNFVVPIYTEKELKTSEDIGETIRECYKKTYVSLLETLVDSLRMKSEHISDDINNIKYILFINVL